jgi:hypothetical protein
MRVLAALSATETRLLRMVQERIQGALVYARAVDNPIPFQRTLQRLPDELLRP